jgi:hypothetical protein
MPKYFFNTRIGDDLIRDQEGVELRDPDHAWEVARTTIRELLAAEEQPRQLLGAYLEVTDAAGEIVLEFPFSEALFDPDEDEPVKH